MENLKNEHKLITIEDNYRDNPPSSFALYKSVMPKETELLKLFSSYIRRTHIVSLLFDGDHFFMLRYLYPKVYSSFCYGKLHLFKRQILKGEKTINEIRKIFADKIYHLIDVNYGIEEWNKMYKDYLDNYPNYQENESEERCKELLEKFRKLSNYKYNNDS